MPYIDNSKSFYYCLIKKNVIMKLILSVIALVSFAFVSSAQSIQDEDFIADELPAVVIKNAGKDFSVYLPDRNPDTKVRQMQDKFVGYNIGKDYEGHDEYLVFFDAEEASLMATYNDTGKLVRVVEKYDNVKLPRSVIFSVYKSFPGWVIVKDKFLYTQADGDVLKKQYNLKIKKDRDVKRLVVNPNGEIVAGL
ncbi:hypothetical protein SAMN05444363_2148 [Flavobacterium terrae]|uniref:Uncharacterized protein n=2 Tax=Flavobacterium terrae TaxID=415425 RepID=A0A1M6F5Q4_9FLAO|nr:hypothetical protein SAMN05444363_2148 [Flavobacterium terrae]